MLRASEVTFIAKDLKRYIREGWLYRKGRFANPAVSAYSLGEKRFLQGPGKTFIAANRDCNACPNSW